jgi:hypothetical protein
MAARPGTVPGAEARAGRFPGPSLIPALADGGARSEHPDGGASP